jgi:hypothetical protein
MFFDNWKKYIQQLIVSLTGREAQYNSVLLKNSFRRLFLKNAPNQYVFILSPPYTASTLLAEFLSSSPNVSILNSRHTCEGQTLPEVYDELFEKSIRWDTSHRPNWEYIYKIWHKYWDVTKPLLLEKSPPHIIRADQLQNHFQPAFFIILVRNPLVLAAIFRNNMSIPLEEAAKRVVRYFEYQQKNLHTLENTLSISYQEFVEDLDHVEKKLLKWLPLFQHFNPPEKYRAHNKEGISMSLTNLNKKRLQELNVDELQMLKVYFKPFNKLFSSFNYAV